jgi:hypothetical protein
LPNIDSHTTSARSVDDVVLIARSFLLGPRRRARRIPACPARRG